MFIAGTVFYNLKRIFIYDVRFVSSEDFSGTVNTDYKPWKLPVIHGKITIKDTKKNCFDVYYIFSRTLPFRAERLGICLRSNVAVERGQGIIVNACRMGYWITGTIRVEVWEERKSKKLLIRYVRLLLSAVGLLTLPLRMWDVVCSNIGLAEVSLGFSCTLQSHAWIALWIRPRPLPSTSFRIIIH
jgi:hypothetical protein